MYTHTTHHTHTVRDPEPPEYRNCDGTTNCVCGPCWGAKLDAVGGPAPITEAGIGAAARAGLIQQTKDGISWAFQLLPRGGVDASASDALDWLDIWKDNARGLYQPDGRVKSNAFFREALRQAVTLGCHTAPQVEAFLGLNEGSVPIEWVRQELVDCLARDGFTTRQIIDHLEALGDPYGDVTVDSVCHRRRRAQARVAAV